MNCEIKKNQFAQINIFAEDKLYQNNKMKNLILITFSVWLLVSCSGVKVVNVKYADKINKNYFVYALPKNLIVVDIEVTEVRTIHGPYFEFAESLMGIKGAQKTDKVDYFISGSDITLASEPDSNQFYFIFPKCRKSLEEISLTNNNILLSVNRKSENNITGVPVTKYFDSKPFPVNLFTELSQKDYFKEHIDTVWKQVKLDTSWARVPVQKKSIEAVTFEDKAKEAAHHIMRLRKRLFKLVSGAYEKAPKIKSMETVINELKSEEEEYLSLFIGKTYTRTLHYKYIYSPVKQNSENKEILAYLNPEKGVTTEKSVKTLPVILEVIKSNQLSQLDTALKKSKRALKNQGIVYRVPEMSKIILSLGSSILIEKQLPIAQFGLLNSLPSKFLNHKKNSVEFDPQTGNIRNLE